MTVLFFDCSDLVLASPPPPALRGLLDKTSGDSFDGIALGGERTLGGASADAVSSGGGAVATAGFAASGVASTGVGVSSVGGSISVGCGTNPAAGAVVPAAASSSGKTISSATDAENR